MAFWELLSHQPLCGGGIVSWAQPGPWALSQTGHWVHHNFGFSCCIKDVVYFRIMHVGTMALPQPSMPWNCLFTRGKECCLAAYPNLTQLVFIERPVVTVLLLASALFCTHALISENLQAFWASSWSQQALTWPWYNLSQIWGHLFSPWMVSYLLQIRNAGVHNWVGHCYNVFHLK